MTDIRHDQHTEESMIRYRKAAALMCAFGFVVAACGGDDDSVGEQHREREPRPTGDTSAAATTVGSRPTHAMRAPTSADRSTSRTSDMSAPAAMRDDTSDAPRRADWGATLEDGEYGENYNHPDPALVDTGMAGPTGLPSEERARNIALADRDPRRHGRRRGPGVRVLEEQRL